MFRTLRHKIARWLFADEVAKVELERAAFIQAGRARAEAQAQYEAWANAQTIEGLVRKQLKGYDPKLLDNEGDILESLPPELGEDQFLAKAKDLKENTAFTIIVNHLIREQILYTVKQAPTVETLNFGRATINGLSLCREEVERLAGIYVERHATEPPFDEHEVV